MLLAILTCAAAPAAHVHADGTADEADLHFRLGNEAYRVGNFLGALEHYLASNRLVPNHNVVFNIARTYQRLEMYPEAYRYYASVLAAEEDTEARERIAAAMTDIAQRVALIDVQTSPEAATVFVDRFDLGSVGTAPQVIALPAGTYRILARLVGHHDATSEPVTVQVGQRHTVRLDLPRIVGVVRLRGHAGAEVRVDAEEGAVACVLPCELRLAPGPHVLQISAEGHEPTVRAVTVVEGETTRVDTSLAPQTGSIVVRADVEGAQVRIDDATVGFTPVVASGVPVGRRRVSVSARGYEPETVEVDVARDEQVELTDLRLRTVREVSAASRETESVDEAPASVSIVTAVELDAFRYPTVAEALRGQRGFAITDDSIYTNASVRGIGQPNDYNNRLLILSDGATLNENILQQAFIGYDARVDLGDVERIEIVRGAGSVLYGTGAVSGVVNLVPRAQDLPTGARFALSLADGNVARARAFGNVRLSDDAGFRASVSVARSGGRTVGLLFDADGDGTEERNVAEHVERFDAVTGNIRAWAGPFTLQLFYTARTIDIPTGSFDTIFGRTENNYDDHRGLLELRFEPRLSDTVQLRTRVFANVTYFNLDYIYDSEDDVTGVAFEQAYGETYGGVWVGGEARLAVRIGEHFRLSAGAEATHHPVVRVHSVEADSAGVMSPVLSLDTHFSTMAGYVLGDWTPNDRVKVSLGARVDGWLLPEPTDSFGSFNPRLAVVLRPTEHDTLKVLAGRSFRAPSIYELFYEDGGFTTLSSSCCGGKLSPETLYSGELEYTRQLDEDWSLLLSVHAQFAQDFIESRQVPPAQDPDGVGLLYFANSRVDQLNLGADVEARREFRDGWMLAAQLGYLAARYLESPTGDGVVPSRRVPNAPYLYASTRAVFPIVDRLLRAAARVSVDAPRRIDLSGLDDSGWAVIADVVLTGVVGELGLNYAIGVYNLFDWHSDLPVNPFASRTMPQRGRRVMLSVSLDL
ncbi:MAG: TonB-dependent receptor [Polyangiales bacterium]